MVEVAFWTWFGFVICTLYFKQSNFFIRYYCVILAMIHLQGTKQLRDGIQNGDNSPFIRQWYAAQPWYILPKLPRSVASEINISTRLPVEISFSTFSFPVA